jgi:hypothetical protein
MQFVLLFSENFPNLIMSRIWGVSAIVNRVVRFIAGARFGTFRCNMADAKASDGSSALALLFLFAFTMGQPTPPRQIIFTPV